MKAPVPSDAPGPNAKDPRDMEGRRGDGMVGSSQDRGGRDPERERDRRTQQASTKFNDYFIPKEGIDREVISEDLCRYLGKEARIRAGNYEVIPLTPSIHFHANFIIQNPQTRQIQQGYFITASRNLTTVSSPRI
jgi:hypothetical protein